MRKLISLMHCSLDGFVAGPEGEMDWITVNDEIFHHVEQRIKKTDTGMYGRVTYQMMEAYWPTAADQPNATRHDIEHSKWYKEARKIVLSNTLQQDARPDTLIIGERIAEQINALKQDGDGEILLFGSPSTSHTLVQLGLIDGYWLFISPIIIGKGIPLFKNIEGKRRLKLTESKLFESGVLETSYELQ